MYLAHRPLTTIAYKMSVVISSERTWTIGDPKPARTSPYDGTEPVILLRPEDMNILNIARIAILLYFVTMLHSSKAFDRVNFWLLFQKLLSRNVPLFIVRILAMWYTHKKI